jgi:hypothetical protein
MQKFNDLLEAADYQVKRVGIETKAYVPKAGNGGGDNDNTQTGGDTPGEGELEP